MANDRPYISERHEDLTPGFLTAALRESGHLQSEDVTDVDREELGDGEGFLGVIFGSLCSTTARSRRAPAHSDFRLDNLWIDDRESQRGVAAFDWQLVGVAPPPTRSPIC